MTKEQEELKKNYDTVEANYIIWVREATSAFRLKNGRNPKEGELLSFSYNKRTGQNWQETREACRKQLEAAGFVLENGKYIVKDTPVERPDEKKVDRAYKDWKKRLEKEVKTYLDASEKTKATPSEDQVVKDLNKTFDAVVTELKSKSDLNTSEYIEVVQKLKNKFDKTSSFDSYVRAEYKKSLNKVNREINGQEPYSLSNDRQKELDPYVARARKQVSDEIQRQINAYAQTGQCPSEEQFSRWLTDAFTRAIAENKPENATDDDIAYINQQLESKRPYYMQLYRDYASTVTVTNTMPGTQPASDTSGTASTDSSSTPKSTQTTTKQKSIAGPSEWTKTNVSFSGCDMVVTAEMRTTSGARVSATLGSVQTISYSIYRKLSPILNIGNINAKDYVGGPRTIAGSLVFTVFNQHWGTELIDRFAKAEGYKSSRKILMDEVAPIDITIAMANEYGTSARLALYSVRLFSEGQVMSINDIYTENTYQYVALNIDYLVNIEHDDEIDWDSKKPATIEPTNYVPVQQPTEGVVSTTTPPAPDDNIEVPQDDEVATVIKNGENAPSIVPYDTEGNAIHISDFKSKEDCLIWVDAMRQVTEDTYMKNHPNVRESKRRRQFDDIQKKYEACVEAVNKLYDQQKEKEEAST